LFKKKEDGRVNNGRMFTDEERELAEAKKLQNSLRRKALEMRNARLQHLKQLQEQQFLEDEISSLEEDVYGEQEEATETPKNEDELLMQLLNRVMNGGMNRGNSQPNTTPSSPIPPTPPTNKDLSDEEIVDIAAKVPPHFIKEARKSSILQVYQFIKGNYPHLTENSIIKLVSALKDGS